MRQRALLSIVLCAGAAAGCGSPEAAPSLGPRFSGTYDVRIVPTTVNGGPFDPAAPVAQPVTLRWVVQSSCVGEADACIAVAEPIEPAPAESLAVSGLSQPGMGFVYEDDAWTRGIDPPAATCRSAVDEQPIDEPWSALHLTELRPVDADGSGPIAGLTGDVTAVQGGTCSAVVNATITLTRTGEVPDGTTPPQRFEPLPADPEPPGAVWRGAYEESTRPKSTTVGDISTMRSATSRFVATPFCTRDGLRCMVVLTSQPAKSATPPVFDWTGSAYERSSLGAPVPCASGGTAIPHIIQHFEPVTPGTESSDLLGLSTRDVTGDCAVSGVWDVYWRHTG